MAVRGNFAVVLIAGPAFLSISAPVLGQNLPQTLLAAPGATASTAQDNSNTGLGDIVVTAQRREESLQKVPIAITAVTASFAAHQNITSTVDIQTVAPSVNWGSTVGGANISIRGIQGTGSAGDESANAVYIDGVYNPVGGSLIFGLNNIERIEILKGPQGTLFGRNASGGAIQIITKKPSHVTHVDGSIGYGRYRTVEASLYATTGLTNTLAADVSFYGMHMGEGWGRNFTTGKPTYKGSLYAFRTKAVWQVPGGTDVTAIYSHNENSSPTQAGNQVLPGEGVPYVGFYNATAGFPEFNKTIQDNGSIKIEHNFDHVTVVNIASVDFSRQIFNLDADARAAAISAVGVSDSHTDSRSFTEELQLLSPKSSRINWATGVYYYGNRQRRNPIYFQGAAFPGGQRIIYSSMPSRSYSAYGQVTVPLGDRLRVTGGVRYTKDRRSIDGTQFQGIPPVQAPFVVAGVSTLETKQRTSEGKLTWHGAVDYQLTRDALVYVSATRGFKSGFFNITSPGQAAVGAQTVDAYEVGFKTSALDNRIRVNGSAFYNNFSGIQLRQVGAAGPQFYNAAKAVIKGFDLDLAARPFRDLTLQGGVSYLDGKYDDFVGATIFFDAAGIAREKFIPLHGRTTIRSPRFSGSIGAIYTIRGPIGEFDLSANLYHNSGFFFDPENRVSQPHYNLVNASVMWKSVDGKFDAKVWGKNIAGEKYYTEFNIGAVTGDLYMPAAPATYGVSVGFHF